jgi:aminopeptidase-like protein
MNPMLDTVRDLTPLRRVFCSKEYDQAVVYLKKRLPFRTLRFHAKEERNGWVIPPKWDVIEAKILKDGKVIYDGLAHPLGVIVLSKGFEGEVGLEELKRHLHYDHRYETEIPYHFRQEYRPWARDWGFCVPKRLYNALEPGRYRVVIRTEESEGYLDILEYTHEGENSETFVFMGHLDHPGMSNDDLAGCAVGVELFKKLINHKTKYSYRLILLQEMIGSEYYLAEMKERERRTLLEAVFLEMLGSETQLALQSSQQSHSNLEQAFLAALKQSKCDFRTGPYRSIVCNDECVWEAYRIPTASLSRYPYPEYHSSADNVSIISERALEEALQVLWRAIEILEKSSLMVKKFDGNICLSNPKYNLYIDPGQPAFGVQAGPETKKLRLLMDLIPTLHHPVTIDTLSKRVGLPKDKVSSYLEKWVEKGLLEIR